MSKPESKLTFIKLYDDYIAYIKSKKNVDDADNVDNTIRHLNSNKKKLTQYFQYKYNCSNLFIDTLNFDFISGFKIYLKTVHGNCTNTVDRAISKLKTIIRYGIRMEKIMKDPFINHRGKKEPKNRQFLTINELNRIEQLELIEDSSMSFVRDFFLFL